MDSDYAALKQELAQDWGQARRATERAQRALDQARERLPRGGEPPSEEVLARLGTRLRELWEHPALQARDRKRLLSTLLEEAVVRVDREAGRLHLLLRWRGGWIDERELPLRARPKPLRDPSETVELVGRLARLYSDEQISTTLTRQGRRTARGLRFTKARVRSLRQRHGIAAYRAGEPDSGVPLLGVTAAARELGVASSTLYRWIREGLVAAEEPAPGAPWLVRIRRIPKSELTEKVRDWAETSVPEPAQVRWPWSRNRVAGMLSGGWPALEATPRGTRAQRSRPRSPRGCWVPHPVRDLQPSLLRIRAGCCGLLHCQKTERATRPLGELLAAGRMRAARAGPSRTHTAPSQRMGSSDYWDPGSCYRPRTGMQPAGSRTAGFRPRPGRTPGADSSPPWRARCSGVPAGAGSRSRGC